MSRKLTLEEFKDRFQSKWPDKKYTFEKAVYVDSHTKMCVTCSMHGDFNIRPVDLLNGYGCPCCGMTGKSNTEDFITKARKVHNNYFSYAKTIYVNNSTPVVVTCPIHGDFKVRPNNHLQGQNCIQCRFEKIKHEINKPITQKKSTRRLTQHEFLDKTARKWGDTYLYDKSVYVASNKKIIVTCPLHGDFTVTPNHHLRGRGCPKCGGNKSFTNDEMIQRIKGAHPSSLLDFSQFKYKTIHTPVVIRCLVCGNEFSNSPGNLIFQKQGCPHCKPQSHAEENVKLMLKQNNFNFKTQYKFDNLKSKRNLIFDFYLPDEKVVIECQGIQHFEFCPFFHQTIDNFHYHLKKDELKRKFCKENSLRLIYFADYEYQFPYDVITDLNELLNIIKRYGSSQ